MNRLGGESSHILSHPLAVESYKIVIARTRGCNKTSQNTRLLKVMMQYKCNACVKCQYDCVTVG